MKKKLVVLSGAGISAESGLATFRDNDGLWENHRVEEVATPEAWQQNPQLVLEFYNMRRRQLKEVKPNSAHIRLAELETYFSVQIITQNVDDLHERAGSTTVLHVHGELRKSRSSISYGHVQDQLGDIRLGDKAADGSQLRPHIVWFGEEVPAMAQAAEWASQADIFLIVGTSLQVYPAAGLVQYVPPQAQVYCIDPSPSQITFRDNIQYLENSATAGMERFWSLLVG